MTRIFKPDSGQALEIQDEGGSAALTVETDGDIALTQDIYLASGKGIYFDGGTTSANYLGGSDAYETGTWTPQANVVTFASATGKYVKVGSMVILRFQVVWPATADSGQARVGNFPFNAGGNNVWGGGFLSYNATGYILNLYLNTVTQVTLREADDAAVVTNANVSGDEVQGTVIYFTS